MCVFKIGMLRWELAFSIAMYVFNVGIKFDLFYLILWLIMGFLVGGFAFGSAMYYYAKKLRKKALNRSY